MINKLYIVIESKKDLKINLIKRLVFKQSWITCSLKNKYILIKKDLYLKSFLIKFFCENKNKNLKLETIDKYLPKIINMKLILEVFFLFLL